MFDTVTARTKCVAPTVEIQRRATVAHETGAESPSRPRSGASIERLDYVLEQVRAERDDERGTDGVEDEVQRCVEPTVVDVTGAIPNRAWPRG